MTINIFDEAIKVAINKIDNRHIPGKQEKYIVMHSDTKNVLTKALKTIVIVPNQEHCSTLANIPVAICDGLPFGIIEIVY